ncbi:7177_t:CDS:2 [Paraglomus brasilianum]|uniref:7177_t:CDS:1 n=1 Tax=Paraglomus brasilianum TaxID=144538 RepID=A0A9N9FL62_9GLOM|nr:7177_t:CDS:2 [Paraglomus brasilianum]
MGGCCSVMRRKGKRFLNVNKFEMIDGRRYQRLDDSNYALPNDIEEEERLDLQHNYMKLGFGGTNFSAPVDALLRRGARVLDVGCGSGTWVLELAKEYPNSYFVGLDLAPVILPEKKPDNVEFTEYNVLDGLPYKSNSFDFVFARILLSVFTRAQWTELAVPEYARVTKPGGWVELMEFDEALKGGCENVDRLSKAWSDFADSKGLIASPGYDICDFLKQSNYFTNVNYEERHIPVGPMGSQIAELGIRDWRDVWRAMKLVLSTTMQVSSEHYDAIAELALQELMQYGCTWINMRAWGQKIDYGFVADQDHI